MKTWQQGIGAEWICGDCGGPNVQGTAWIYLNTNEIVPGDPPDDDVWCDDCEEHVRAELAWGVHDDAFVWDPEVDTRNRVRDDVWSYGPGTCFLPEVGPRAYVFLRVRREGFVYAQHGLAGWGDPDVWQYAGANEVQS